MTHAEFDGRVNAEWNRGVEEGARRARALDHYTEQAKLAKALSPDAGQMTLGEAADLLDMIADRLGERGKGGALANELRGLVCGIREDEADTEGAVMERTRYISRMIDEFNARAI